MISHRAHTKEDVTGSPLCACSNLRAQKMCFIRQNKENMQFYIVFEVFLLIR